MPCAPSHGSLLNNSHAQPIVRQLQSTKASRPAQGSIQVKLGLLSIDADTREVDKPYQEMVRRSQDAAVTLVSAPPVGTNYS